MAPEKKKKTKTTKNLLISTNPSSPFCCCCLQGLARSRQQWSCTTARAEARSDPYFLVLLRPARPPPPSRVPFSPSLAPVPRRERGGGNGTQELRTPTPTRRLPRPHRRFERLRAGREGGREGGWEAVLSRVSACGQGALPLPFSSFPFPGPPPPPPPAPRPSQGAGPARGSASSAGREGGRRGGSGEREREAEPDLHATAGSSSSR